MEAIMMPVIVLGVTGILMGLFLAYASKKFEVQVDPKVEAIMAILPGVNCGGCGYPGCAGYAMGVVEEGISMTLCAPGGPKVAQAIGDIMGVAVEMPVKKKPEKKKPAPKPVEASSAPAITAPKEFIEKNKKSLTSYKEAFDAKDEEKMIKLEELAKKVKKDELLKYYEEIKSGKSVPDPATMVETVSVETNAPAEKKKEEAKVEVAVVSEKEKEEQSANYCSVLGDGLCVPEQNEKISKSGALDEILGQPKVEKVKELSSEEKAKEAESANYCSVLGDGLCVPEQNEEIVRTMNEEIK